MTTKEIKIVTNTEAIVRRGLSDDYSDKVIVTTIQKLGLALDENDTWQQIDGNVGSFKTTKDIFEKELHTQGNFRFAPLMYLPQSLEYITAMPQQTFE